jgi:hypothetical protein
MAHTQGADRSGGLDEPPVTAFRDIAIIGGGCYGTFYAGQLDAARARGRLTCRRVLLVDRNPDCRAARAIEARPDRSLVVAEWAAFLDDFLARDESEPDQPDDAVVPSPFMPHLMAEWLRRVAAREWPRRQVRFQPLEGAVGTPYDRAGPDGTRYVSFADWICPTHCVEPHLCPVIRGPRTWEMSDAVEALVTRLDRERPTAGPALFVTRHRAFGVGMFDAAEARRARERLLDAGASGPAVRLVIGTISSCHGALSVLELGP